MAQFFMYGTLRKGYAAHNRLVDGKGQFLGLAVAQGRRLGTSHFVPAKAWELEGELYEIPDKYIPALDEYEGHPGLYERKLAPVLLHGAPGYTDAWIYHSPNRGYLND